MATGLRCVILLRGDQRSEQPVAPVQFPRSRCGLRAIGPKIDYERKLWGVHDVEPSPKYLGGLKLKYCLEDLEGVRGKVLEIGCGGGAMTRSIKRYRPDLEVHGLDLSKSALSIALDMGGDIDYGAGDADRLPFAPGTYDAVVMLDILEHLPDPKVALAEVHRILVSAACFIFIARSKMTPETFTVFFAE